MNIFVKQKMNIKCTPPPSDNFNCQPEALAVCHPERSEESHEVSPIRHPEALAEGSQDNLNIRRFFGLCPQNDRKCHPERSEGSHYNLRFDEILRTFCGNVLLFATPAPAPQNDRKCVGFAEILCPKWLRMTEYRCAFTLAETLITLVIIGIVSAITVPMLKNSTDGKEYNVARQKARASVGEAFRLMSLNGEATTSLTTEQFVKKIVPKYIKIDKSCSTARECGFPTKIKRPNGSKVDLLTTMKTITSPYSVTVPAEPNSAAYGTYTTTNPTTNDYNNAYFFTTLDGFHIMFFYNPYCVANSKERPYYLSADNYSYTNMYPQMSLDTVCYYGTYDMNGTKGPNQVGKDIGFVGAVYNGPQTQAVAVLPHSEEKAANAALKSEMNITANDYWQAAYKYCDTLDKDNWTLPDVNELSVIYLNKKLVTDNSSNWFWSRSPVPGSSGMRLVHFVAGSRGWGLRSSSGGYVRCVRRTSVR